jgi:hypothetical protein
MRSQIKHIRRPLTNEELESVIDEAKGAVTFHVSESLSIRNMPLEERRNEARKPLYLSRL